MESSHDLENVFIPWIFPLNHCVFICLPRTLCNVVSVMTAACLNCSENCWYLLLSNKLSTVVDLLAHHLTVSCFILFYRLLHKDRVTTIP